MPGKKRQRSDVALSIGDDCALLAPAAGELLAITVDTLVSGVHFFADTDPERLGHKTLAVNLSDLAAMGAAPAWATLALTLPAVDHAWLDGFCRGLITLADAFEVQLVGGDTTRGPLTITLQAHGFVPADTALRRDGAQPGDRIFVTGTPGDAGLALAILAGKIKTIDTAHCSYLQQRLERPSPRIAQGLALRGLASAAIDISDGLAQDLMHILERSGVGATVFVEQLPCSQALAGCLTGDAAFAAILAGGDDYELCFTVPHTNRDRAVDAAQTWNCRCTEIGIIEADTGLRCQRSNGSLYPLQRLGYDHFG